MDGAFQVQELIYSFMKRIKLLIIVPLLFASTGLLISLYAITPIYQAQSDLLVNQTSTDGEFPSTADVEMNLRLIETYQFILKSPRIHELVLASLDDHYRLETLEKSLTVKTNPDSQIISLFVEDPDPAMANKIVNLYATSFQNEISKLMKMDNVSVLNKAKTMSNPQPIRPKPILYTVLSLLIGIVFALIYVLISVYFNAKVHTKSDVENMLGIPLLGTIGRMSNKRQRKKEQSMEEILNSCVAKSEESSFGFEAYRTLRTNIQFQKTTKKLQTILITSTEKNEGKSLSSANLGIVMTADNKKTIVIDADLRNHVVADAVSESGLTTYLAGYAEVDEIILPTAMPNLSMIKTGPIPPNPTELLSSLRMDTLLAELESKFDMIIIDSPPMIFSDAAILATKVDGCLFISNAGKTKTRHARQAIEQLGHVNANIVGAVLNNKKERKKVSNYYNYRNLGGQTK